MDRAGFVCVAGLIAALQCPSLRADFPAAMQDYAEGRLEQARAEFLTLAALGDSASQFNLGAMAMQGQAGPKDMGQRWAG